MVDVNDFIANGRFAEAVRRLSRAHSSCDAVDAVAGSLIDWPAMGADVLDGAVSLRCVPCYPSSCTQFC